MGTTATMEGEKRTIILEMTKLGLTKDKAESMGLLLKQVMDDA